MNNLIKFHLASHRQQSVAPATGNLLISGFSVEAPQSVVIPVGFYLAEGYCIRELGNERFLVCEPCPYTTLIR